jgi:hypothetical protein
VIIRIPMASQVHADHDHIVARQERYIAAYRQGSAKAMMEFMDEEEFVYSDFGEDTKYSMVSPSSSSSSSSLSSSLFLSLVLSFSRHG